MHCDSIKLMLNDFFNKTLSSVEERKVEGHLAECENCRCEFGRLEKADNTLKKVMHEIVAGIEVPNNLNERIEAALALEKRPQPRLGLLLSLVKTPAVAAALLLVVLGAGFLSYYNFFIPALTQQKVVLSDTPGEPLSVGSGSADMDNTVTTVDERASAESQDLQVYDTNKEIGTAQQSIKQPAGEPEKSSVLQPPSPAAAMKTGTFEDTQTTLEKRSMAVSSTPQAAGADAPALSEGTAAGDASFVPARPTYLPQGMKFEDVSWRSGVVYQNYRIGNSYVTISQSRAPAAGFNYDELAAGGVPVNINGAKAVLEESGRDSNDNISGGYATVRWQRGEWVFSVSGGLPGEEILKIASSLE